METTGNYASFLNGKVDRPHRTITAMVRAMLLNAGLPSTLWCYASKLLLMYIVTFITQPYAKLLMKHDMAQSLILFTFVSGDVTFTFVFLLQRNLIIMSWLHY